MRIRSVLAATAASLALMVGVAACSSDDSSPAGGDASSGDFTPVTIEHKFGSTTITKRPERVAVVGVTDADAVLALGVTPVAIREWAGQPIVPDWAKQYVKGDQPQKLSYGNGSSIDIEEVAKTRPDLIIGIASGMTEADYTKLSKIAPTVAPKKGYIDWGQPWDVTTLEIGQALGQETKAQELVDGVKKRFADAKAANPQWQGKSAVVATFGNNQLNAFAKGDSRASFFESLGFTTPDAINKAAGDNFYTGIPLEKAGILLNVDLVVWDQLSWVQGGKATIEGVPALKALRSQIVWVEPKPVESAFGWQSVLSLPIALDGLIPALQKAFPAS